LLAKLRAKQFDVFGPRPTRLSKCRKALLVLRTWWGTLAGAAVPAYGTS
jgi:hypothetical protein